MSLLAPLQKPQVGGDSQSVSSFFDCEGGNGGPADVAFGMYKGQTGSSLNPASVVEPLQRSEGNSLGNVADVLLQIEALDPSGNMFRDTAGRDRVSDSGEVRLKGDFRVGRLDGEIDPCPDRSLPVSSDHSQTQHQHLAPALSGPRAPRL